MTLTCTTEFNEAWEGEIIPPVVHVEMKNVLIPSKKTMAPSTDPPLSQKTQLTTFTTDDVDFTDQESEESSLSHVETIPTKKRRIFRCLMQAFFPFRRTMTTEEYFASFRKSKRGGYDDNESQSDNLSDVSILPLPEVNDEDLSSKHDPRSRRRLFRGRRVARSRRARGWNDSVASRVKPGSDRSGLAPLGEEEVAF